MFTYSILNTVRDPKFSFAEQITIEPNKTLIRYMEDLTLKFPQKFTRYVAEIKLNISTCLWSVQEYLYSVTQMLKNSITMAYEFSWINSIFNFIRSAALLRAV